MGGGGGGAGALKNSSEMGGCLKINFVFKWGGGCNIFFKITRNPS